MKKIIKYIWFLLIVLCLASCKDTKQNRIVGTGEYLINEYDVTDVTAINISDIKIREDNYIIPIKLYIENAKEKKLQIEAQQEIIQSISVDNLLGTISISSDSANSFETEYIIIRVSGVVFQTLNLEFTNCYVSNGTLGNNCSINLSNACYMKINAFDGSNLNCKLSTGSMLKIDDLTATRFDSSLSTNSRLDVGNASTNVTSASLASTSIVYFNNLVSENVSFDASDTSSVDVSGECNSLDLIFSGSSNFQGYTFDTSLITIIISGGAQMVVNASNGINVVASGTSSITYYGDAILTQTSITGKAKIVRGDDN